MGAVVPHLPVLPWKGRVEERHRPASVTPAAGVVGGRLLKVRQLKNCHRRFIDLLIHIQCQLFIRNIKNY